MTSIQKETNNHNSMKIILLAATLTTLVLAGFNPESKSVRYTVAKTPWESEIKDNSRQKARSDRQPTSPNNLSLGNHRAIIRVPAKGEVAHFDIEWRRHDKNNDKPRFIIINAQTQDTVANIYRAEVNN